MLFRSRMAERQVRRLRQDIGVEAACAEMRDDAQDVGVAEAAERLATGENGRMIRRRRRARLLPAPLRVERAAGGAVAKARLAIDVWQIANEKASALRQQRDSALAEADRGVHVGLILQNGIHQDGVEGPLYFHRWKRAADPREVGGLEAGAGARDDRGVVDADSVRHREGQRDEEIARTAADFQQPRIRSQGELARDVDTHWGEHRGIDKTIEELKRHGARRVGIMGPLVVGKYKKLESAFDMVSLDADYVRLRLIKSDEEIDWLRIGAALSDAGFATLLADTKPGMEIGRAHV